MNLLVKYLIIIINKIYIYIYIYDISTNIIVTDNVELE